MPVIIMECNTNGISVIKVYNYFENKYERVS